MKTLNRLFYLSLLLIVTSVANAHHIKGGWIGYIYKGQGSSASTSSYQVTVYLYASCTENGPTQQIILGAFDAGTNASVLVKTIPTTTNYTLSKTSFNSCLTSPPSVCYHIYTYTTTIQLSNNTNGYLLTVQDALRVDGIVNISGSGSAGITFTSKIPGTINGVDYHDNSSPLFDFKDTAIICKSSVFSLPFSATDPIDGDSLSYSFGAGLNVTNPSQNTYSSAPATPPYSSLTYINGYTGTAPLGSLVTVNPVTGLISGTPPSTTGEYVIAVYVKEWRNGVLIDSVKKELQVIVANCNLTAASLQPSYINCEDYSFTFSNLSSATTGETYHWDFGVKNISTDVSTDVAPTYVYADTGTYSIKLTITNNGGCSDSATSIIKVYPGFSPDFRVAGSCYQSPFTFTDASTVKYGSVNSWSWDFGDLTTTTDVASSPVASYTYPAPGTSTVVLNITSTKGCSGSVSKLITMNGKPDISLPFTDTLICNIDSLPLIVNSSSATSYAWTPNYNIINANTANPIVYPTDTTVYTVVVRDKGCVDSATITVNVLDFIDVKLPADTTICTLDSIQLTPVSYALKYAWSPATGLSNTNIKYPNAAPQVNTVYTVTANLGKCQATASELVRTVPYPVVNAGLNDTICFGTSTILHAIINASSFTWSPNNSLQNAGTLTPVASPQSTTNYILTVTDTLGCPKAVRDTVQVYVIPTINLFAGNDTTAVLNQPLQLMATGGTAGSTYIWSPTTWLNTSVSAQPVVTVTSAVNGNLVYTVKVTDTHGCTATDNIVIRVFNTAASIFVPTAFSPNSDGRNDVFKPTLAGVRLGYFRIYNRWGQDVFYTTQANAGWDGSFKGEPQSSGAYVWIVQGIDYTGKTVFKKGTMVLVR